MAKKTTKRNKKRQAKSQQRKTNWTLIGSVMGLGVLFLGAALYLSLQGQEILTLEERCEQSPEACIATGAEDAPVTIIEVLDFGCPHCRNFHLETDPLIKSTYVDTDIVRYVVFPFALSPRTSPAAHAGMCADEQSAYFSFADALFAQFDNENYLTRDSFITAAENSETEINVDSFAQCIDSGRYNDIIEENQRIARTQRITGTPAFFVNGIKMEGAQPFSAFQQRIESLIN